MSTIEKTTKIPVKNTIGNEILVSLPELHFIRTWAPNSVLKVPFEILEEAIFDKGFSVFIKKGMLHIEDEAARIELGLQEPGEPDPVKILNPTQMLKLLKGDSIEVFKKTLSEISHEQHLALVDLAVKEKVFDMTKSELLKEVCGVDFIRNIQLNAEMEKAEKKIREEESSTKKG